MPLAFDLSGLSAARLARISDWMKLQVAQKKLPGLSVLVSRRGETAFFECAGLSDIARAKPMREDTIVRIYSMTKPLTSAAIMMLYEEGRFQLDDPVSRFLPVFANQRVFVSNMRDQFHSVPAQRDITFRDLLTHTSGLTYHFMDAHPVDRLYAAKKIDFQTSEFSLAELVDQAAKQPLVAQPGTEWNYSISTDVLGRLVEVISGKPFDVFLREKILRPLGMTDTDFHVPESKLDRFAVNYALNAEGALTAIDDSRDTRYAKPPPLASGGGGLVSTASDYLRFCRMMLNKGELEGTRLLGRKTVELMMMNHLKGDMADMGQPRFSESTYEGIGFGLGFSVMIDPARAQIVGTQGECSWGGAASTFFFIDPKEEMIVLLLTQLTPSSTWPIRRELRALTYQAIVD